MPYIKDKEMRNSLNSAVDFFINTVSKVEVFFPKIITKYLMRGNLNYFLFKLAKETCKSYGDFADFRSELIEAHDEIGRRLLVPYEDKKIKENGDVE